VEPGELSVTLSYNGARLRFAEGRGLIHLTTAQTSHAEISITHARIYPSRLAKDAIKLWINSTVSQVEGSSLRRVIVRNSISLQSEFVKTL
jgi:hypothetical protein